ncbi:hypothetical protein H0H93_008482, partial [Arthromyces matolae]
MRKTAEPLNMDGLSNLNAQVLNFTFRKKPRARPFLIGGLGMAIGSILTPLLAAPILGLVGFGAAGPVAGTMAAAIQSGMGSIAAGSPFALAQSIAMGGAAVPLAGVAAGGGILSGISFAIAKLFGA